MTRGEWCGCVAGVRKRRRRRRRRRRKRLGKCSEREGIKIGY